MTLNEKLQEIIALQTQCELSADIGLDTMLSIYAHSMRCRYALNTLATEIMGYDGEGRRGRIKSPWLRYLEARAECIDMLYEVGNTDMEIAKTMSMDSEQVKAIRTRPR